MPELARSGGKKTAQCTHCAVGTSMSSGFSNLVIWNDIHLKTQKIGSEHGYPDPNFLANLMQELAGFRITEAEIGAHMTAHPNLRTRGKLG